MTQQTHYNVFVRHGGDHGDMGGITECKSLTEAKEHAAELERLGYGDTEHRIEIWEITRTRLR